jgi:hypothetical protein
MRETCSSLYGGFDCASKVKTCVEKSAAASFTLIVLVPELSTETSIRLPKRSRLVR